MPKQDESNPLSKSFVSAGCAWLQRACTSSKRIFRNYLLAQFVHYVHWMNIGSAPAVNCELIAMDHYLGSRTEESMKRIQPEIIDCLLVHKSISSALRCISSWSRSIRGPMSQERDMRLMPSSSEEDGGIDRNKLIGESCPCHAIPSCMCALPFVWTTEDFVRTGGGKGRGKWNGRNGVQGVNEWMNGWMSSLILADGHELSSWNGTI